MARAAQMLNVGERTVKQARQVIERAAPETLAAVERGALSLNKAARRPKAAPLNYVDSNTPIGYLSCRGIEKGVSRFQLTPCFVWLPGPDSNQRPSG